MTTLGLVAWGIVFTVLMLGIVITVLTLCNYRNIAQAARVIEQRRRSAQDEMSAALARSRAFNQVNREAVEELDRLLGLINRDVQQAKETLLTNDPKESRYLDMVRYSADDCVARMAEVLDARRGFDGGHGCDTPLANAVPPIVTAALDGSMRSAEGPGAADRALPGPGTAAASMPQMQVLG